MTSDPSFPDFEQLATSEVLTRSTQIVAVIDSNMVLRWVSPSAETYGLEEVGVSIAGLIHDEDLESAAQAFDDVVLEEDFRPSLMAGSYISIRVKTPHGLVPFEASARWIDHSTGERFLVASLHDVSTRHGTNVALRKLAEGANELEAVEAIVAAARGYGGVVGAQMVWHSDRVLRTFGDVGQDPVFVDQLWPSLDVLDGPWSVAAPAGAEWTFAFPLFAAAERLGTMVVWGTGTEPAVVFAAAAMSPLLDLAALSIIRSRELAELNRQATTDHATGLLNRHAFFDTLERIVDRCAVIYVDLDEFKSINDRYGHTLGDRLLSVVSRRLVDAVPESHSIGRLGGDEFAIACFDISVNQAVVVGERIGEALNQVFVLDDHRIKTGASVGIAVADRPLDGRALIDAADQALLAAKAQGKGRVVLMNA